MKNTDLDTRIISLEEFTEDVKGMSEYERTIQEIVKLRKEARTANTKMDNILTLSFDAVKDAKALTKMLSGEEISEEDLELEVIDGIAKRILGDLDEK